MATILARLHECWPDATCELDHANAYQLLVATILSAQSTDRTINTLTPALFARYPDPRALAQADPGEVERMIHASGFFRVKARHITGMARAVVERHGGEIPATMDELIALPGVARKTANVVLGTVFGKNEGVVVDTHVQRLSRRLGLSSGEDPVEIEHDLMAAVPRDQWTAFAHRLIWHGRRVCHAKKPNCDHCALAPLCPSAELATSSDARRPASAAAKATVRTAIPRKSSPRASAPRR